MNRRVLLTSFSTAAIAALLPTCASAKYHGQDRDSALGKWFGSLLRPDRPPEVPLASCCGEGDAYEADDYKDMGDHYHVVITDGSEKRFPDGSRRIPIPNGLAFDVPKDRPGQKGKVTPPQDGNPTGHAQLFLSVRSPDPNEKYGRVIAVWCFVPLPPST
jgi:hypothetical protein